MRDEYEPEIEEGRPRDKVIDEAKETVLEIFNAFPKRIFYSVQIETKLETQYFHWIVGKALLELANEEKISVKQREVPPNQRVNFYRHPTYRYPATESKNLARLLEQIYEPEFTHAVGRHCEMLLDSAFARAGFIPKERDAKSWKGEIWTHTNHNLDRIVVKDDIGYGVEIKNTQNYITREELRIKIRLCKHLGLKPLFVMRYAPKSYMHEIIKAGGFGLLFEEQIYPFGFLNLMRQVRKELELKVQCPRDFKEGDMQRLANWHERTKSRPAR